MYKEVKIAAYCEPREGTTQDGRAWKMQDIVVMWEEENVNHEIFQQRCLCTTSQSIDQDRLKEVADKQQKISARIYFDFHSWNDRLYAANRVYLSNEILKNN